MKRVVSVSLGSARRDHRVVVNLLGEEFEVQRQGTDGDLEAAEHRIRELDGTVDAIGLGGIDVYLFAGDRRYELRDGLRLKQAAVRTPVVDGSGVKRTLEPEAVRYLVEEAHLISPASRVLMVSALDRYFMAEAFVEAGCPTTFGDLIFALGMPYPIHTLEELAQIARKMLPELAKMPFNMLYPTGKEQETAPSERFAQYYQEADVVAGDFHYLRKFLPARMDGKLVLTQTVTREDVEDLRRRGTAYLVTTTPEMEGRSFATNVIEGILVSLLGKPPEDVTAEEYRELLHRLDFRPRVEALNVP